MFCGFWAIGHLPLAQAISLAYSSPIFITIAAALWLGEHVRMRRWLAVAAGFVGVLVIVAVLVIVPDSQLSLAIGREGQNARLAARLTGWRIDIVSDTAPTGEPAPEVAESIDEVASVPPSDDPNG